MTTLRDIGEDALIQRLIRLLPAPADPLAGPGDDCAVVASAPDSPTLLLLKTDALVAGVHFHPDAEPEAVGWKAVARVVSDFAAMGGGEPGHFLITVALPPSTAVEWVEALYRGMARCLETHGGTLAGGETTSVPADSPAVIAVAATATIPHERLVLRSTARPGDWLFVTGTLGGSLSGRHLCFPPRLAEAKWLATHHRPTAMMDLSDGLAKDLPRLAAASACGFLIEPDRIPRSPGSSVATALNDGEDFELLFTCPADRAEQLTAAWSARFPAVPMTVIGHMTSPEEGQSLTGGWDHFARTT